MVWDIRCFPAADAYMPVPDQSTCEHLGHALVALENPWSKAGVSVTVIVQIAPRAWCKGCWNRRWGPQSPEQDPLSSYLLSMSYVCKRLPSFFISPTLQLLIATTIRLAVANMFRDFDGRGSFPAKHRG